VFLGPDQPVTIIGERINPTGKSEMQAELRSGRFELIRRQAIQQIEHGAAVLDVNVGLPGIDEAEAMVQAVTILSELVAAPLSIDTPDPEVAEAALRLYPGRALMNSISAQPERLEKLLPVAAKYGAMIVALPMAEGALPGDCPERIRAVETILAAAAEHDVGVRDVLVDGLAMSVTASPEAARQTLDMIAWATKTLQAATVVGLSNTSFGLPGRAWLNASFLSAAVGHGLTAAIANPGEKVVMAAKYAADAWRGQDQMAMQYIRYYRAVLSHHDIVRSPKAPKPEPVLPPDGDVQRPKHPEKHAGETLARRMLRT
jgi:5-methyltetrahydrofolate--homocysteine methyltransferase